MHEYSLPEVLRIFIGEEMPSREEERMRNLNDKKLRYHNGNYEKYCDKGWPLKHGWFVRSRGCPKCNHVKSDTW